MIIVTGGAGFIGSNIVKGLNERGREDILVVDHLKDGKKFRNLVDCEILDYIDKVRPSNKQAKLYGSSIYERQGDDMEILKSFAEFAGVPVMTATHVRIE